MLHEAYGRVLRLLYCLAIGCLTLSGGFEEHGQFKRMETVPEWKEDKWHTHRIHADVLVTEIVTFSGSLSQNL